MNKEKIYYSTVVKIYDVLCIAFMMFLVCCILGLTVISGARLLPFIFSAVLLAMLLLLRYLFVIKRFRKLRTVFRQYLKSYNFEDIFEQKLMLSESVDVAFGMVSEKLNKSKNLSLSRKQAQYLALQNQINPHFLYNTLECIRSEALCQGMDGVASMTEALATFFRYTISNVDKFVTLEDELTNVENYYLIQQYRFGDRLDMKIEYGNEDDLSLLDLYMPKLTLQPIVENSIYHGLERKLGNGSLRIKMERTREYLIIRISDNGLGIEKDRLDVLNRKLLKNTYDDISGQENGLGGIAIMNVNNRIKLLFGEQYGINIQSVSHVGTDVEITLPVIEKQ